MKTKFALLTLAISTLSSSLASAMPREQVLETYTSQIEAIQMDQATEQGLHLRNGAGAELAFTTVRGVDTKTTERRVSLMVDRNFCKPNQRCPMVALAPFRTELTVTEMSKDRCGNQLIIAKDDKRMIDGNLRALRVMVANPNPKCDLGARMAPVAVELVIKTSGFKGAPATYRMSGTGSQLIKLSPIYMNR